MDLRLDDITFLLIIAALAVILIFIVIPIKPWLKARSNGLKLRLFKDLLPMRIRRVPVNQIVSGMIISNRAGVEVDASKLETHHLAGGDVNKTVDALILAKKAGLELSFDRASAIVLSGRDVLKAVRLAADSITVKIPEVQETATDGTRLKASAVAAISGDLDTVIGGASEHTLIERIRKELLIVLRNASSYQETLSRKEEIAKSIYSKRPDAGTAFKLKEISVNIYK